MGTIIIIIVIVVILLAVARWFWFAGHRQGKRMGSRKGFGVGFDRAKRLRGQQGCLGALMIVGLAVVASVAAMAHMK
jgi:hypothetical protein